jgi:hypothetical protein
MDEDLSPQNQMNAHLLARVATLEGILMLLLESDPRKSQIFESVKTLSEAHKITGLSSQASDLELTISADATAKTIGAVFYDLSSGRRM